MESKIVPEHSAPFTTMGGGTDANRTLLVSQEASMDDQNEHTMIRVLKLITITAESKTPVVAVTLKCGLMTIHSAETTKADTTDSPRARYK